MKKSIRVPRPCRRVRRTMAERTQSPSNRHMLLKMPTLETISQKLAHGQWRAKSRDAETTVFVWESSERPLHSHHSSGFESFTLGRPLPDFGCGGAIICPSPSIQVPLPGVFQGLLVVVVALGEEGSCGDNAVGPDGSPADRESCGEGNVSTVRWDAFSNTASRLLTERRIHP
jgi:hypothetical protein